MKRDCGDIVDRYSIAKLKKERIGTEENKKEFEAFAAALVEIKKGYPYLNWEHVCSFLYDINAFIWQFEAASKSGKEELIRKEYVLAWENRESLIKLGITTVLIRDFNHLRIQFKNIINELTKTGFQEVKQDHLSE